MVQAPIRIPGEGESPLLLGICVVVLAGGVCLFVFPSRVLVFDGIEL
jgi:hypothetical protein